MMTKPSTKFILVRTPRINHRLTVKVLDNYGEGFDLSNYSFWRMSPRAIEHPMEEWVPTAELELYERTN